MDFLAYSGNDVGTLLIVGVHDDGPRVKDVDKRASEPKAMHEMMPLLNMVMELLGTNDGALSYVTTDVTEDDTNQIDDGSKVDGNNRSMVD